ncbi:unnamed protein product [Callosobruchus maculatus]|uniref:Uncharacterized protein n=1 Tax=Callosobruchus maculatus TaxID=64391 RepID=A0A653D9U8_CALMS|nr:unnamed protein product [Callosobruchus maculatus]
MCVASFFAVCCPHAAIVLLFSEECRIYWSQWSQVEPLN